MAKYWNKVEANLFPLTCKLLQRAKLSSYSKNNIFIEYCEQNNGLHWRIITIDGWVDGVTLTH